MTTQMHYDELRHRAVRGHKRLKRGHTYLVCHVPENTEYEDQYGPYCHVEKIVRIRKRRNDQGKWQWKYAVAPYKWQPQNEWNWRFLTDAGVIPYGTGFFGNSQAWNPSNYLLDLTELQAEGIEVLQTPGKVYTETKESIQRRREWDEALLEPDYSVEW